MVVWRAIALSTLVKVRGVFVARLMWWCWGGVAALGAVLAVVAWVAWPVAEPEVPRAREYRDYDMCLLTGQKGIAEGPAAAAWAGMQTVSLETNVRVGYMPVSGEQTPARAQQFLATQVQQRCAIIVAVGEAQVAAVAAVKDQYPLVKFVPLGEQVDSAALAAQIRPLIPPPGG